jgi:hypothetical protein
MSTSKWLNFKVSLLSSEFGRGLQIYISVHDFFTPQPVKDASVFLLRYILHDWNDDLVLKILGHLRAAALPTTRLVILEKIVPFASEDSESSVSQEIPGAARPTAEHPLLPNWGAATADLYLYDLTVCESYRNHFSRLIYFPRCTFYLAALSVPCKDFPMFSHNRVGSCLRCTTSRVRNVAILLQLRCNSHSGACKCWVLLWSILQS